MPEKDTSKNFPATGILRVPALLDYGYEAELAVVIDADGHTRFVQFNPLGNLTDVWDGVEIPTVGFVPVQSNDGEVGPVGAIPRNWFGGGTGPFVGALPGNWFGGGPGPVIGAVPGNWLGGGTGPVIGALPHNPFGGGTGPVVGKLPGNWFGNGKGPVVGGVPRLRVAARPRPRGPLSETYGVLAPRVRIGGALSGAREAAEDAAPIVMIAVYIAQIPMSEVGPPKTVDVTLRVLTEGAQTFEASDPIPAEILMDQPLIKPGENALSAANVRSLDAYRTAIEATAYLDPRDRDLLVDQAIVLLNEIYAHLPLKRAMHAIDPVQRLRLLKQRAPDMDPLEFHGEMLGIFKELRDLHTNLTLPIPFGRQIAFLGVLLERFFQDGRPRYLISKVFEHLVAADSIKAGAEVTHWNGVPIETAIARNADNEAGSNMPSRMARGLESMTLRYLSTSLFPEEDWVDLTCIEDNESKTIRLHWLVFDSPKHFAPPSEEEDSPVALMQYMPSPIAFNMGYDERQEVFRAAKKSLFNPGAVQKALDAAQPDFDLGAATGRAEAASASWTVSGVGEINDLPTSRPDEITARKIVTPDGAFGYLRLWSFFMEDYNIDAFVREVMRLLDGPMPEDGLIIDVRGNGGGFVIAAEFLLQLLTPLQIKPEPAQFIATASALEFVKSVNGMEAWLPSLEQAVETGALYSKALPISPPELVNAVGQIYFGPVVLITDAYCYSACDMFAAGFQDHKIGPVIGVDDRTGAGGANVVTQASLVVDWPAGPFRKLPANAGMRVSLRRTMRVGDRAGDPVEDLGVTPDIRHWTTRRDLMDGNADLLSLAISKLRQGTPRTFSLSWGGSGRTLVLELQTRNIDRVDVYVGGLHFAAQKVVRNKVRFELSLDTTRSILVELIGYEGEVLVAKREVAFDPA